MFKFNQEKNKTWHKWFAWYPVLNYEKGDSMWLKFVERKLVTEVEETNELLPDPTFVFIYRKCQPN